LVSQLHKEVETHDDQALPPYPLPETERALIGTGYFHTAPRTAVTREEIETLFRSEFSDRPFSQKQSSAPSGTPVDVLCFGGEDDQVQVHMKEVSHEGKRLLHVEIIHLQGGMIVPAQEEIWPLREDSPEKISTLSMIDEFGMGPPTAWEENCRTWVGGDASAMNKAIERLLEEIPSGPPFPFSLEEGKNKRVKTYELMGQGRLRYRRLEGLHHLLSEGRDLREILAVENGPGSIPDVAIALAQMGSSVFIKEPGRHNLPRHQRFVRKAASPEIRQRILYISPSSTHEITPADIVYWTNPDPYGLNKPKGVSLEIYLGRDVKPGGYLVLQTDHHPGVRDHYRRLNFDPKEWETLYNAPLPNLENRTNYVLPTAQEKDLHLQIYRRRRS
jgi:hypothetical protein